MSEVKYFIAAYAGSTQILMNTIRQDKKVIKIVYKMQLLLAENAIFMKFYWKSGDILLFYNFFIVKAALNNYISEYLPTEI
jgi:uncharacterized ubiquitin-like protein YukD